MRKLARVFPLRYLLAHLLWVELRFPLSSVCSLSLSSVSLLHTLVNKHLSLFLHCFLSTAERKSSLLALIRLQQRAFKLRSVERGSWRITCNKILPCSKHHTRWHFRVKHGLDLLRTKISMMDHCNWMPEEAALHVDGISQTTECYFSSIKKDLCELLVPWLAKQIKTFSLL